MVPNKKKISEENSNNNEPQTPIRKGNSCHCLLDNIPFLLMTLANITFAMAMYISYTYLPFVSRS